MYPRLPKGLIRICVLLWLVKALCQGLGWLFSKKLLAPSLHLDAASGIRESNTYQNHALGPTYECQRMKSGIIDNATAMVNRPSRYRYALLREGLATETKHAQDTTTTIGFIRRETVSLCVEPRATCLTNAARSWNRTGTLQIPMAWAIFSAISLRHARMYCVDGPSRIPPAPLLVQPPPWGPDQ